MGLLPCEGGQGVGEEGVGDPEELTGDLPEMGGAKEGLLALGGGQQALSSTPQSRPSDGIAGTAGVGMNGSRSSAGPTRTGNGDLMQSLSIVHLAGGKWGREWDEERICYSEGVQLGIVCYVFFLFFFFSEVLMMNQGVSSGS